MNSFTRQPAETLAMEKESEREVICACSHSHNSLGLECAVSAWINSINRILLTVDIFEVKIKLWWSLHFQKIAMNCSTIS